MFPSFPLGKVLLALALLAPFSIGHLSPSQAQHCAFRQLTRFSHLYIGPFRRVQYFMCCFGSSLSLATQQRCCLPYLNLSTLCRRKLRARSLLHANCTWCCSKRWRQNKPKDRPTNLNTQSIAPPQSSSVCSSVPTDLGLINLRPSPKKINQDKYWHSLKSLPVEKYSLVKRDQIQCVYLPAVSTHIIPPIASIDLRSMISHEN